MYIILQYEPEASSRKSLYSPLILYYVEHKGGHKYSGIEPHLS